MDVDLLHQRDYGKTNIMGVSKWWNPTQKNESGTLGACVAYVCSTL